MYSWVQRLRSLRHGFWYGVSERLRWSRGAFVEEPARVLCAEDLEQGERIAALRGRYQVRFERSMSAATSANNYEYLDLLDRGWNESGLDRRSGGVFCDIGCASFWYAAADIITSWYPFITPAAVLAWRLPLSLLAPEKLFQQIARNLKAGGLFFMVNHGLTEWASARGLCAAADLNLAAWRTVTRPFSRHRLEPPVLSWWQPS